MKLSAKVALSIFLLFIFLIGDLGLVTEGECADKKPDGEKILCLHEAAITQAIICQKNVRCQPAIDLCNKITEVSSKSQDNIKNIGESQRNFCLADVAKFTHEASACNEIGYRSSTLDYFVGQSTTTRDACVSEVTRLRKSDPEDYLKEGNKNNICSLVFIFPAVLFFAMLQSRKKI